MDNILLEPMAYVFVQGAIAGLIVGFAVRKLNKAIAAAIGFALLAVNVLWFARMMEIDLQIPQLNELVDSLLELLPFSPSEVAGELGPMMPLLTSLPFVGGFLVGGWIGFKVA
ncbi:MAG: FUN14 domain-containing protein [Candidatus Bathyarchaeota archaeon]|nr:FUN14 domain-containing protein [Candidatus Bathyarchaeota archaeon]